MDDAKYLFKQRSVESKRLARGAYAKKGGSRSKKCTLPSDHLTEKQRKELNGELKTYDFSKPMDWKTFKSMSDSLKREYIEHCAKDYKARGVDVAKMFGINSSYFSQYLMAQPWGKNIFPHGSKRVPDPAWLSFIGEADSEPSDSVPVEPVSEPVKEPDSPDAPPPEVKLVCEHVDVIRGMITYEGKPAAVFERAYNTLNRDEMYVITISFHKADEPD